MDKCTLGSEDTLFEEGCLTSASSPEAVEKEVFSKTPFLRGPFWRYLVAMLYRNTRQCVYFHALPAPDAGATCFASHCTAVSLCTISEMAFYDICVLALLGPITCSPSSLCTLSLPLQNQCYKCNLLKSPLTERTEKIHEQKFTLVAKKYSLTMISSSSAECRFLSFTVESKCHKKWKQVMHKPSAKNRAVVKCLFCSRTWIPCGSNTRGWLGGGFHGGCAVATITKGSTC